METTTEHKHRIMIAVDTCESDEKTGVNIHIDDATLGDLLKAFAAIAEAVFNTLKQHDASEDLARAGIMSAVMVAIRANEIH